MHLVLQITFNFFSLLISWQQTLHPPFSSLLLGKGIEGWGWTAILGPGDGVMWMDGWMEAG